VPFKKPIQKISRHCPFKGNENGKNLIFAWHIWHMPSGAPCFLPSEILFNHFELIEGHLDLWRQGNSTPPPLLSKHCTILHSNPGRF
jgi:hypothetical protein